MKAGRRVLSNHFPGKKKALSFVPEALTAARSVEQALRSRL
jgi:hypothetical protein